LLLYAGFKGSIDAQRITRTLYSPLSEEYRYRLGDQYVREYEVLNGSQDFPPAV
jgi:hypothetical protein